jgi:hypothetical protein
MHIKGKIEGEDGRYMHIKGKIEGEDGRYMHIKGKIEDKYIDIYNIYAPNPVNERSAFFEKYKTKIINRMDIV